MAMQLDEVVPFGRSLDEYRLMFALSEADLQKAIIGVADGPASFNAEMQTKGRRVVSVDPLYVHKGHEIEQQFYVVVDHIIEQVKATPSDWVWTYHQSPDDLRKNRIQALTHFLADYERGVAERRYVVGALPKLDWPDRSFNLALCSHFLFLYSDHFNYAFHRAAVVEMLRVADEVRVFPLVTLGLAVSPYVVRLQEELAAEGYMTEIVPVGYELQRGGNCMLTARRHDAR